MPLNVRRRRVVGEEDPHVVGRRRSEGQSLCRPTIVAGRAYRTAVRRLDGVRSSHDLRIDLFFSSKGGDAVGPRRGTASPVHAPRVSSRGASSMSYGGTHARRGVQRRFQHSRKDIGRRQFGYPLPRSLTAVV